MLALRKAETGQAGSGVGERLRGPGGKEKMSYKELSGVAGVHMCTRCTDIYCSLV